MILFILGFKDWYKYCYKLFVFSFVNLFDIGLIKLFLIFKWVLCVIYCRSGYGLIFGVGYDLYICG